MSQFARRARIASILLAAGVWALSSNAQAAGSYGAPTVTSAVQHDVLGSLANTPANVETSASGPKEKPYHKLPIPGGAANAADGALQSAITRMISTTYGGSVDGVGQGFSGPQGSFTVNSAPPDTNGAVGATQYVQIVNSSFAIFDKGSKSIVYGPAASNTLWKGFGGPCETDNDGDAVVLYDKAANRWVISQFAVTAAPYYQCVAVSATSDATGAYYRYAFSYGSNFPDYPKMGSWPDAYYTTFNMFNGSTLTGAQICAYNRNAMLNNQPATQQCYQLSSSYSGVLPADVDGASAPPAGSPNYLLNYGSNSLNLWKFHVDWANSANSSLSGPSSIPVAAFTAACNGGICVPQSGTRQKLDSLADRLMYRLAYRNFGSYESLVVTHSVQAGTDGHTGIRWYELRNPGGSPLVYQQSTYAPDSSYRWMGSAAMDKLGNLAVGYSISSGVMYPSIRFSGRLAGDPLNTLEAEASIIAGGGAQSGNRLSRWGDYSSMAVDPVDDCTFWYTTEYLKTTGSFNWSTRIASFKYPSCN